MCKGTIIVCESKDRIIVCAIVYEDSILSVRV